MSQTPANQAAPAQLGRFSAADFWIFISATLMLLAFFALPWLAGVPGLRRLFGSDLPLVEGLRESPLLFAIPLAGVLTWICGYAGVANPLRKRLMGWLIALVALLGLAYFVTFASSNSENTFAALRFAGAGFWIAFFALIGLLLQLVAPRPKFVRLAEGGIGQQQGKGSGFNPLSIALAPVTMVRRQLTIGCVALAFGFGACGGCALLIPSSFQALLDLARQAGLRAYVQVLEVQGTERLKVITYQVDVKTLIAIQREMGALGILFGEGAEVQGEMRVSLGADLQNNLYGIMSCELNTDTIQVFVGRAPLSGSAFNPNDIEQRAYGEFKKEAARIAIADYWAISRDRLRNQFVAWALGQEIPDQATAITCPEQ
jgi:hypothetical protein